MVRVGLGDALGVVLVVQLGGAVEGHVGRVAEQIFERAVERELLRFARFCKHPNDSPEIGESKSGEKIVVVVTPIFFQ